MDIKVVYNIYNELISDNLSLVYQGNFSDDVTSKILHLSENNFDNYQELGKIKRKVSFIMVECFQNIVRHKEQMENKTNNRVPGLFLTRNIGKDYYIASANIIEKNAIDDLREKLLNINSLTKDDLKTLYLERLENNELNEKGGAGLGLIEMARRSGNRLEFDFETIDDEYAYFYLRIKISKEEAEAIAEKDTKGEQVLLELAKGFRHDMMDNNILMIYKGDFSQKAILPVLKMIEDNLMSQNKSGETQKRVFWVLVEMLQNISKHAFSDGITEGIFMLGLDDEDRYYIATGNLMSKASVETLKGHLEMVNNLDGEGLSSLYRTTLREGKVKPKGGAGLGIIDIARESGDELKFDFIDFDEKSVFFSLNIRI